MAKEFEPFESFRKQLYANRQFEHSAPDAKIPQPVIVWITTAASWSLRSRKLFYCSTQRDERRTVKLPRTSLLKLQLTIFMLWVLWAWPSCCQLFMPWISGSCLDSIILILGNLYRHSCTQSSSTEGLHARWHSDTMLAPVGFRCLTGNCASLSSTTTMDGWWWWPSSGAVTLPQILHHSIQFSRTTVFKF